MDLEKITAEVKESQYLQNLPQSWYDFTLRSIHEQVDNAYYLYQYYNDSKHSSATLYFHDETKEYKLAVKLGQTEFVRMECIAPTLQEFEKELQANLENILRELKAYDPCFISSLLQETNLDKWEYQNVVPEQLEGFSLFIRPSEPRRITNGSYILIDYENFTTATNFIISYNIFRDEFFSETHIKGQTELNYNFDAKNIQQLTEKLSQYLQPYLADVAKRAEKH